MKKWFFWIGVMILCFLFRHQLLVYATGLFLSTASSITYDHIAWERDHLVLTGLRLGAEEKAGKCDRVACWLRWKGGHFHPSLLIEHPQCTSAGDAAHFL